MASWSKAIRPSPSSICYSQIIEYSLYALTVIQRNRRKLCYDRKRVRNTRVIRCFFFSTFITNIITQRTGLGPFAPYIPNISSNLVKYYGQFDACFQAHTAAREPTNENVKKHTRICQKKKSANITDTVITRRIAHYRKRLNGITFVHGLEIY